MGDSDLGKQIKHYRKIRGLTQKDLADKIDVSNVVLSRYESSQRTPDTETQVKLADVLEISLDELYGRQPRQAADDPFEDAEALMFSDKEGFDNLPEEEKEAVKKQVDDFLNYILDQKKRDK
ncbi:helix-turn-helix domain-containing protein [Salinicoccus albus]|uniref:helix-turn-helix domain-containing protein n=1 Tax=Salinicoccus albus TaxID=418756 RepID=UPI000368B8B2|nr:helix-turn-helix transcriptional regulator [Salinicoccus albus]